MRLSATLLSNEQTVEEQKKIFTNWEGSCLVLAVVGQRAYKLQRIEGGEIVGSFRLVLEGVNSNF